MSNQIKILLFVMLGLSFSGASAQDKIPVENPVLFTDRDYCVSGDTLWFKVYVPELKSTEGNIVRVQLDSRNNNLITDVAIKCKNSWAQGFLHVPDSLSTGHYFVTAFFNSRRHIENLELESKSLLVYNRFAENISEMAIVPPIEIKPEQKNNAPLVIHTDKDQYLTREKVRVELIQEDKLKATGIVIKASLLDPLARKMEGKYRFSFQSSNSTIPEIIENDGLLVSGIVKDVDGKIPKDALVALSIGGNQPYFDYYVLGENGDFHFFLKDAVGVTKVVLQVVSKNPGNYLIQLEKNCLVRINLTNGEFKILNREQTEFINTAINAGFAQKLFNPGVDFQLVNNEIPTRFEIPFYGKPSDRILPRDFIDLPDFQEIARELLPGFQYRIRNEEVEFRMINSEYKMFFEKEPLRLINGIPVFKNDFFVDLSSNDIDYIDILKSERIFGDLIFKGVLAVYLTDKSNSWLAQQPNIFEFNLNLLQPFKSPGYLIHKPLDSNYPDMRQVYFWKIANAESLENFDFYLSDRKGDVEISIEGYLPNNEFFRSSKVIEVK